MTSRIIAVAVLLFLPLPIVIVVLSSFTSAGYLSFPIKGVSLRWYAEFLGSADWLRVMGTSALLALIGATVSTAASLGAAWAVVRHRIRFGTVYETILLTPLIFPHAAIGVIMIVTLSSLGWLGTFTGLVLVHCILTIPYAYRPVAAALRKADPALEEAAASLGSRPWRTFWQVSLPAVRPGLVTSLLFSFIISFDEVTVTMFLVGPFVMTLPVQVFSEVLESASPVIAAVSATLVLFTSAMVFVLDRVIGIQFFVERD
ncbi:ABC transporter permease [Aquicoccus porphyridii]|uniref:ABC transporter permease n=1 Tax=Aquicoccus porphyridii TaxID=1852029 RepID=A0A5A9Z5G7_9RHOB|nr:ABC transporter permease [Aquicoccus porphyridii]KAA0912362.1 ABC transporter permease [Aquicoccus porphyridii]RAI54146.1 ABC transporter permease [Rhodobacteraceae bacterium AsT-22]